MFETIAKIALALIWLSLMLALGMLGAVFFVEHPMISVMVVVGCVAYVLASSVLE